MSTGQPQGSFTLNLNYRRKTNPKAAAITGRISTPEDPDKLFEFSAFEEIDDKGQKYWIGPVDMVDSVRKGLNATPTRGTHFIAIRENGYKVFAELADGSPNPEYERLSDEQKAKENKKPAYWATWTRNPEKDPPLRAAAWERSGRFGPWASGTTQHPLTKEQAEALKKGAIIPDHAAIEPDIQNEQSRKRSRDKGR